MRRAGTRPAALLLALALAGCQMPAPSAPSAPAPAAPAQLEALTLPAGWALERAVGEAMAHRLIGEKGGLLASKELRRYLSLVGAVLARDSDRPDIPYHFGILDADEVSAFGLPGGFIFVTRGLLLTLGDEAELAAALAKEVAHVARGHMMAHLLKLPGNAQLPDLTPATFRENPGAFDALVEAGMARLLVRGLPPEEVFEADRLAAAYMARTGYDRGALASLLRKIESLRPGSRSVFRETHPAPAARAKALEGAPPAPPAGGGGRLGRRYRDTIRRHLF